MYNKLKKIGAYKFTSLTTIIVLILIVTPGKNVPSVGIPNIDKLVHFCMFGGISFCYYIEHYRLHHTKPSFVITSLCLTLFGLLTEIMQYFISSRSCDLIDLGADTLGILIVSFITCHLIKIYEQKKEHNMK